MISVLRFATAVAGVAAENMVRGGAWLFLDLGRRMERAQAIASRGAVRARPAAGAHRGRAAADAGAVRQRDHLSQPLPDHPAAGARRSTWCWPTRRNPRALAFQLEAISRSLSEVGERRRPRAAGRGGVAARGGRGDRRRRDRRAGPGAAPRPACRRGWRPWRTASRALSDAVTRRYFALLPAAQTVGPRRRRAGAAGGGVIYRLRHVTTYAYAHPVDLAAHLLLLTPRALAGPAGGARRRSTVTPAPSHVTEATDHFGNLATPRLHRRAACALRGGGGGAGRGALPRPARGRRRRLPWEVVRDAARASGRRRSSPSRARWRRWCRRRAAMPPRRFPPGRPVLVGLLELMARIRRDFTFKPGVTGPTRRSPRCWRAASASARTTRM